MPTNRRGNFFFFFLLTQGSTLSQSSSLPTPPGYTHRPLVFGVTPPLPVPGETRKEESLFESHAYGLHIHGGHARDATIVFPAPDPDPFITHKWTDCLWLRKAQITTTKKTLPRCLCSSPRFCGALGAALLGFQNPALQRPAQEFEAEEA